MRDECEHGHLRRSCDMCNVIADHVREITEKNAEIAELRYSLSQAHSVAQACAARAERAEANAANWEEQANDRVSDWDEVRAERDALRAALSEAIVMVKHWGGYAPNYYQQKWDLEGDLDKLRAAIDAARGG